MLFATLTISFSSSMAFPGFSKPPVFLLFDHLEPSTKPTRRIIATFTFSTLLGGERFLVHRLLPRRHPRRGPDSFPQVGNRNIQFLYISFSSTNNSFCFSNFVSASTTRCCKTPTFCFNCSWCCILAASSPWQVDHWRVPPAGARGVHQLS